MKVYLIIGLIFLGVFGTLQWKYSSAIKKLEDYNKEIKELQIRLEIEQGNVDHITARLQKTEELLNSDRQRLLDLQKENREIQKLLDSRKENTRVVFRDIVQKPKETEIQVNELTGDIFYSIERNSESFYEGLK